MIRRAPGSSPLARGLLLLGDDTSDVVRIIPARAGFTDHGLGQFQLDPDHPRSRGVYCPSPRTASSISGSSPLARGLHHRGQRLVVRAGIIPARAGFTFPDDLRARRRPDHPRSRGVYAVGHVEPDLDLGSSPLARGLHLLVFVSKADHRIIPARAGFTRERGPDAQRPRDHPRSRGVYGHGHHARVGLRGSSPLARGLRDAIEAASASLRIIPARAGFTFRRRLRRRRSRDHPRSRGVYPTCGWRAQAALGSSPLARGLRPASGADRLPAGIIPARAGFTDRRSTPRLRSEDHPRSRGVYKYRTFLSTRPGGSSPLARGLRWPGSGIGCPVRIIPARAGFTAVSAAPGRHPEDHPRSRGVYGVSLPTGRSTSGSSPLARGLQGDEFAHDVEGRIIPARAGFTPRPPSRSTRDPDHPRSRGVYTSKAYTMALKTGSSPLARGLRGPHRVGEDVGRIIPARAGFTRRGEGRGRNPADHPRSRGVYSARRPGTRR